MQQGSEDKCPPRLGQRVGSECDDGEYKDKVQQGHLRLIRSLPCMGIQPDLASYAKGAANIPLLGRQAGGTGPGVHESSGTTARVLRSVQELDLNVEELSEGAREAFDIVYGTKGEDNDRARTDRLTAVAIRYRTNLENLAVLRGMTNKLKRGLTCYPAYSYIGNPDYFEGDNARHKSSCKNGLACPYCRERFVRDLVFEDKFNPGERYAVLSAEYNFKNITEDRRVRDRMVHTSRELRRRFKRKCLSSYQRLVCLNVEMDKSKGLVYKYREAFIIQDCVKAEKLDSVVYTLGHASYLEVLEYIFKYSYLNISSTPLIFEGLLGVKKVSKVSNSQHLRTGYYTR